MGAKYLEIRITETGNQAFVDVGRANAIAATLRDLAGKVEPLDVISGFEAPLHDINGNRIGQARAVESLTAQNDAEFFAMIDARGRVAHELLGPLRDLADKVEAGDEVFTIKDANGAIVAKCEWRQKTRFLLADGRVDLLKALQTNNVYLADQGTMGLADGEYRYLVPQGDYEVGYAPHQGEAWLVNALGEVRDEPNIRDTDCNRLPKEHRDSLLQVASGVSLSFEAHEALYGDDDADLEPD